MAPPPLGPGAPPKERLIAYGRARMDMLRCNHLIVRASVDRISANPMGGISMTPAHIHMLLREADPPLPHPGSLALQLAAALEGPLLLFLSSDEVTKPSDGADCDHLSDSWQNLVERVPG